MEIGEYKHRLTLVVPEAMMINANHLALVAGESPDDINTFMAANWQDVAGNKYAVCSAAVKPIVLSMFGQPVADSGLTADGANFTAAQRAMDAAILYSDNLSATPSHIVIAIDVEPLATFAALGLSVIDDIAISDEGI